MTIEPEGAMVECAKCHGSGICQPCRGSGHSGYFLILPEASSPACRWCIGTMKCDHCDGAGAIPEAEFRPYIHVERSLLRPTSIMAAASSGAPWRFLSIPIAVQHQSEEVQFQWVSRRVQTHYHEHDGKLFLFGDITGYRWLRSESVSVMLDIHGQYIETKVEEFIPGGSRISVGNKTVEVEQDGSVKIDAKAAERE